MSYMVFFFFKQKTAYEVRISDWSSDVCSSDLLAPRIGMIFAGRRNGCGLALYLRRVTGIIAEGVRRGRHVVIERVHVGLAVVEAFQTRQFLGIFLDQDRKSTRLNSSH